MSQSIEGLLRQSMSSLGLETSRPAEKPEPEPVEIKRPELHEIQLETEGEQLDLWVAAHVMGWTNLHRLQIRGVGCPDAKVIFGQPRGEAREEMLLPFSGNMNAAWSILAELRRRLSVKVEIEENDHYAVCRVISHLNKNAMLDNFAPLNEGSFPAATAICRAALIMVLHLPRPFTETWFSRKK